MADTYAEEYEEAVARLRRAEAMLRAAAIELEFATCAVATLEVCGWCASENERIKGFTRE